MISVLFWCVGIKFGRLSKPIVKSPCSPQPPVGVAVADVGGNGLLKVEEEVVRVADFVEDLRLLVVSDCPPDVMEECGELIVEDIELPVFVLFELELLTLEELDDADFVLPIDTAVAVLEREELLDVTELRVVEIADTVDAAADPEDAGRREFVLRLVDVFSVNVEEVPVESVDNEPKGSELEPVAELEEPVARVADAPPVVDEVLRVE